jgi:hypothetical protein
MPPGARILSFRPPSESTRPRGLVCRITLDGNEDLFDEYAPRSPTVPLQGRRSIRPDGKHLAD